MNEYNELNMVEEQEGISLQELFKIVWNNIALILIITMWVLVIGIVYTFSVVQPKYTANSSLMVQVDVESSGTNEQSAIVIANNLMGTYKEFIVSNRVLESVQAELPELSNRSISSLKSSISISITSQILIIYISVVDTSPELAQKIANTLVENSIEIANDPESPYVLLQNKLKVLDVAKLPTSPSSPNKTLNVIISGLLGGILALGVVFVKEFFNNKYKTVDELERHLNIKVLAAVPGTIKERKLVD
ncbi:MAG: Wzz/FepE/Etk N-terminal domain-containing protein [Candidatus Izemoplasmatales bacterium]|jgi:capsular polysaccharide biosynthesis protein|nr:Wzz/FepE/Etk N-terminal domain-containing protein [Candidatus Izemoplasmatales bacterium]